MGKKRKKRKGLVVTEEVEVQPAPGELREPEGLAARPRLVRQLSGATGVRTLSPRDPSPKADGQALAGTHKKRKGADGTALAEKRQSKVLPARPRLVRQLSGATGVRTLSPRDPSPKADGQALEPVSHAAGKTTFLAQNNIQIQPLSAGVDLVATETFETAAGLYGDELVAAIRDNVASLRPTTIQAVCWALTSPSVKRPRPRDLIAVAETGAGKTFAFLLPAVARVQRSAAVRELWPRRDQAGPSMLVLAPTRELAQQIHSQLNILFAAVGGGDLRSACVLGGQTVGENPELLGQLFRGVEAIVATPGRLLNLLDKKKTHLRRLGQLLPSDATGGSAGGMPDECGGGVLIIDEADRMLGLGFEGPIRRILAHAPSGHNTGRQTLLFSATWSSEVEAFGTELVHEPVRVTAGSMSSGSVGEKRSNSLLPGSEGHYSHSVNQQVQQEVMMIASTEEDMGGEAQRLECVVELLSASGYGRDERGRKRKAGADRQKVLIFTSTKKRCENLSRALQTCQIPASRIHGDRPQEQRDATLAAFAKEGKGSVLVATDVAARGLHVNDIDLVVNYDFPLAKGDTGVEQYVHRVGRTGRAGKQGRAVSFFEPSVDGDNALALLEMMSTASGSGSSVPPPAALVALAEAQQQKKHNANKVG
jgi:ATP-dependent RNA helicase DDX5/DBP2